MRMNRRPPRWADTPIRQTDHDAFGIRDAVLLRPLNSEPVFEDDRKKKAAPAGGKEVI